MKRILLASAAMVSTASAPPPAAPQAQPFSAAQAVSPRPDPVSRFPGFAASLANRADISSPAAWEVISYSSAWTAIANSTSSTRQQARWDYARSLIGSGLAGEAIGVLDVMLADDPDLAFVPSYAIARGAVLVMLDQPQEAANILALPRLAANPEACAWRLRALGDAGRPAEALRHLACALPALRARKGSERIAFVLSASQSALAVGKPDLALRWLGGIANRDPAANLLRGRANLALGKVAEARLRFNQAEQNGNIEQKADARLSFVEGLARLDGVPAKSTLKRLNDFVYRWRGDDIEERALKLSYALAAKTHDIRSSLAAGSVLFRYFRLGNDDQAMLAGLQASLLAALSPESKLPIDQAAGLFWDYRDLTPAGTAGDFLVSRLGERLQAAGLYGRAAELLEHQLLARTTDIAQGPLSTRVATLHILSGRPDRALAIIRKTDVIPYPADMLAARHRVEAVALTQLGKTSEALAILQSVPDGTALKSEILWRSKNWSGFAATAEASLPSESKLGDASQTVLLRQAIALAMLGREKPLARLRARYARAFVGLPSAGLFDLLTRPIGSVDPSRLGQAMAGIPAESPAGEMADLLEAQPSNAGG